jgi:Na+-driven multidrug efflux pump
MTEKETFDETNKKARRSRKIREAALLLPIIGIILLLTPVLKIFTTNNEVSPLINSMLFIFGVWAVLISAAFILSRLLIPEIRDK